MGQSIKPNRPQQTVLIVEDDFLQCEEIAEVLADQGVRVVTAQNGFAAMHAMRRNRPSVVVLDINLPGLDGLEVAKLMQGLDVVPKLILISGHSRRITQAHREDLGAFAIVEKPIMFPVLTRFVLEAMGLDPDELNTGANPGQAPGPTPGTTPEPA